MHIAAVIVAAGRGLRAGGGTPKQWRPLLDRPLAAWTLDRFRAAPEIAQIILVMHPDDLEREIDGLSRDGITCVAGGSTRDASVFAGLQAAAQIDASHVMIHDVARPCLSDQLIATLAQALHTHDAVAPGLAVSDALWIARDDTVIATQDRSRLMRAQTPQCFALPLILAAHKAAPHTAQAADDVELARAAGHRVAIVSGEEDNIKVTTAQDFARAERILKEPAQMDIRLGNGYDVHRFGAGDHVVLCGVNVPFSRGLQGHSDADVGMHAVTDAIYGALAQGDIGQHFPPSDPQWKGAASEIFLKHAVDLAAEQGFAISNVDCTLVCEMPKIGPHADAMKAEMARIMGMDRARVSVKATTSEQLGFTGRGEGIAALATATLVKP